MINLSSFSNQQILNAVTAETQRERRTTAYIVRYLAEIESRRLHLELGFTSLFDFATKKLGYSSSSALRRIKAARLILAEPSVAMKLETGELNFSTVDVLSNFIKEPELRTLTEELCGRTREDAEKLVAHLRPVAKHAVRDRVKPIVLAKAAVDHLPTLPFETDQNSNDLRMNVQPEPPKCEEFGRKSEEQYHLSFAMSRDEKELLDRSRRLMFNGNPATIGLGTVIGRLAQFYLTHHCPKERERRREARRQTAKGASTALTPHAEAPTPSAAETTDSNPRSIPIALRDRVLARDGHRCTFVSAEGNRCTCMVDLEIDHIVPIGRKGRSTESNLRVLCRPHNLEMAYRTYGEQFVKRKIAEQRAAVTGRTQGKKCTP